MGWPLPPILSVICNCSPIILFLNMKNLDRPNDRTTWPKIFTNQTFLRCPLWWQDEFKSLNQLVILIPPPPPPPPLLPYGTSEKYQILIYHSHIIGLCNILLMCYWIKSGQVWKEQGWLPQKKVGNYQTQVYTGSDLWVQAYVSGRPCWDLTDVTSPSCVSCVRLLDFNIELCELHGIG